VTNGNNNFRLRVWGEYACFTRPEMKVERVSYDVMTPSAARNILQAILWKPAIDWQISQIDVLKPIRWISIRRNEVESVVPMNKVATAIRSGEDNMGLFIEDDRQQRAGLFLRDVEYIIHASFRMTARAANGDNDNKFREQFVRRASRGQCFWQPYLGCREFTAFFELMDDEQRTPIKEDRSLGWMLFDMDFSSPRPTPMFFNAELKNGSLSVPPSSSEVVKR